MSIIRNLYIQIDVYNATTLLLSIPASCLPYATHQFFPCTETKATLLSTLLKNYCPFRPSYATLHAALADACHSHAYTSQAINFQYIHLSSLMWSHKMRLCSMQQGQHRWCNTSSHASFTPSESTLLPISILPYNLLTINQTADNYLSYCINICHLYMYRETIHAPRVLYPQQNTHSAGSLSTPS